MKCIYIKLWPCVLVISAVESCFHTFIKASWMFGYWSHFYLYIRLLSVKGCHSKGALIIPYKLNWGVNKVSWRGRGIQWNLQHTITYIHRTSWRSFRNPMLYIVFIASYGRATAVPVAVETYCYVPVLNAWDL